jgi:hypothetical protein
LWDLNPKATAALRAADSAQGYGFPLPRFFSVSMRDFARLRAHPESRSEFDVVMRSLTYDLKKNSDFYLHFLQTYRFS